MIDGGTIIAKGKDITKDVVSIKKSANGRYCYIVFKSGPKTFRYLASDIEYRDSAYSSIPTVKNSFDALKLIADRISVKIACGNGQYFNVLNHHFDQITSIPHNSILASFLSGGELPLPEFEGRHFRSIIYPFGFNKSQKTAIDQALNNSCSVIEGPPGTGKTQTILNIIANIVLRGSSVAVVSNNNSATHNVLEKLEKYGMEFFVASLGSKENKIEFLNQQGPIKDLSAWRMDSNEATLLRRKVISDSDEMNRYLELQRDLVTYEKRSSDLQTELQYFFNTTTISYDKNFKNVWKQKDSYTAVKNWTIVENFKTESTFWDDVLDFIFYFTPAKRRKRFIKELIAKYTVPVIITQLQYAFYEHAINECWTNISSIKAKLQRYNFEERMDRLAKDSRTVFQAYLSRHFSRRKRRIYELSDLYEEADTFVKDYPVILSSTYSVLTTLSSNFKFDYVIMDEASQIDLCTGTLALSCAKHVVIVGDLMQLPNIVTDKDKKIADEIFYRIKLPESLRYSTNSLLKSIVTMYPNCPRTLLCEHYRCAPDIIEFCNQKFYNGKLIVMTKKKTQQNSIAIYATNDGNHARNRTNQRQVDVILKDIIKQEHLCLTDNSLGIVTPYRNQRDLLREAFRGTTVQADTVDKFQGREKKAIIISTVDNDISTFTDDPHRLNVAVSRAIDQLIVVVNGRDSVKNTNVGDLINYALYHSMKITHSSVSSIFDLLYKMHATARKNYLRNTLRISEFDSENLMKKLLDDILSEECFSKYDVAVHVPMRMLIIDTSNLSVRERAYATHPWTHFDFVIFDKLCKAPVLVIEVDGVSYHQANSIQGERDRLKNHILQLNHIPYLRLKTNGSGESDKIRAALKAA